MPKQQINIKLPPPLIDALRARATEEGITLTDLIQGFCEQGLGLLPSVSDLDAVYERISVQLDRRILFQVDERIAKSMCAQESFLRALIENRIDNSMDNRIEDHINDWVDDRIDDRINYRISERIDDRIASTVQKELEPLLGEPVA